jgi:hypothetical protein
LASRAYVESASRAVYTDRRSITQVVRRRRRGKDVDREEVHSYLIAPDIIVC